MCEKRSKDVGSNCMFSYKSKDRTIFITKKQAEEVWHQYCRYSYAADLKSTIAVAFEDDEVLNDLIVSDLFPYVEILKGLLRENSGKGNISYADCCKEVISLYVKPKLEEEGKYEKKD